jgi:ATP-dependent exoDNAse (exonuclease V), alpha subunit - helicase superfamily I member
MLKYYEYLHRLRGLLSEYNIQALENLEKFPIDLDLSLREYHEKIADRIAAHRRTASPRGQNSRYYIHKIAPFFVKGHIYYEVTFYPVASRSEKIDRIIGFTDVDINDKYTASLTLEPDSIEVFGQRMPIMLILKWEVSIRPCEFDNFARLLGISTRARSNSEEYRFLMRFLTEGSRSLLDLMEMPNEQYTHLKASCIEAANTSVIFPVLDRVRDIIRSASPGHNVLRYLMLRLRNQLLKQVYNPDSCGRLSYLRLPYACIPFDEMPFCTSLPRHNPRYWDLAECIDASSHSHELLVRRVKNNVERHGKLYTSIDELTVLGDFEALANEYNSRLYYKHRPRRDLACDKNHAFIVGYEDDTDEIIKRLKQLALRGISGYTQSVERWLTEAARDIDDQVKIDALKTLFSQSHIALIYGAAGTGKSTMVNHIAHYFNDKRKLFLTHTNPAIDNLKRKVTAQGSDFRTISSHIHKAPSEYDILIIDECSTVSNESFLSVLNHTSFRLLVLVGDLYQIESIEFGNWFSIIREFLPSTCVFELKTPYRTKNQALLEFWNKVRNMEDDIAEVIVRNSYATVLNESLFKRESEDETILCLNYDGLYGINNINRFLQSSNPAQAIQWGPYTYKIDDPVLFHETERFRPVIYNNLKGWIRGIIKKPGHIQFAIQLDRPLNEFDVNTSELIWLGDSTVGFSVYEVGNTDDDNDDTLNTTVPFQVAYAVSIHKAQGLEYDSVKVVITDANEEDITHSIFYTAVTRAREKLRIFWTPETQQRVLARLKLRDGSKKDVHLLAARRGLTPVRR